MSRVIQIKFRHTRAGKEVLVRTRGTKGRGVTTSKRVIPHDSFRAWLRDGKELASLSGQDKYSLPI